MKVYATPVPFGEPNYKNYDHKAEESRVQEHQKKLAEWLKSKGYNGKYSGKIISFPVGDGGAQYMLADGKKSFLIHLPYWDSYQYPDVRFLPKAEIIRRLKPFKA